MKKLKIKNLDEDFVEVNGEKLHASRLIVEGSRILIKYDDPEDLGLRIVPGHQYYKSRFRLVDTRRTSWRREVLKRAKYALKNFFTSEIEVKKCLYGNGGPGDLDNRGGAQTVRIIGQSVKIIVPLASLEAVWSVDFERWLESDRIASSILTAMTEVLCHRWGEEEVRLGISELNSEFFSLYSSIAGHKPAFEGEVIGY